MSSLLEDFNPNAYVPRRLFLTRGVGKHKEELQSFEMALRNACIAEYNLVSVSSIFPPGCKVIPRNKGVKLLKPGQIVYTVLCRLATNEPHRLLAASVGMAVPADSRQYGYLSEHHVYGKTEEKAGDYAEDLAASMLATILDVPFDADKHFDQRKDQWKISGKIIRTCNITQTALGDKDGLWTTVVAAAVFV